MNDPWADVRERLDRYDHGRRIDLSNDVHTVLTDADALLKLRATLKYVLRKMSDGFGRPRTEKDVSVHKRVSDTLAALPKHLRGDNHESTN